MCVLKPSEERSTCIRSLPELIAAIFGVMVLWCHRVMRKGATPKPNPTHGTFLGDNG